MEKEIKINKVVCSFVSISAGEEEMIMEVNNVLNQGTNLCIGNSNKYKDQFNALLNAKDIIKREKHKLVIKVIYESEEDT